MKDSQGNLVLGRTRWRRFAAVVVPATIAVSALMGGIASGAVPVAFNISGQTAMLTADQLYAEGFNQWGGVVLKKDKTPIPVAASQIKYAEITNLCQSVRVPGTNLVLTIRGGGEEGKPVVARNLLIGMDYLSGDAVFTNIEIGTDASTLTKGGKPPENPPLPGTPTLEGQFGQQADIATIKNLRQRFYSTTAGEFHLTGMTLQLNDDGVECFTLEP